MSGGKTFRGSGFSTGARRRAFTLIELLVVISILVLLMALLLPVLSRARKQARAAVCRGQLRQWGTLMAISVSENEGRISTPDRDDPEWDLGWAWGWGYGWGWGWKNSRDWDGYEQTKGIRCCPMATKPVSPDGLGPYRGGTFLAWGRMWPQGLESAPWTGDPYSSYGVNHALWLYSWLDENDEYHRERAWRTIDVRGRDRIPVQFDCAWAWNDYWYDFDRPPPECDAVPTMESRREPWSYPACINRHAGGINVLFLDWSVRKVGLKELWTLKWHRQCNTSGPWTKAGGALPADWPQWMRNFKDY